MKADIFVSLKQGNPLYSMPTHRLVDYMIIISTESIANTTYSVLMIIDIDSDRHQSDKLLSTLVNAIHRNLGCTYVSALS